MEIKTLIGGLNPYEQKKVNRADKVDDTGRSGKAKSSSDKISLSDEARLRGTAYSEALSSSGVRSEKVEALRQQLQDGTYEPDLEKTARNLVRDDMDLLL